MTNQKLRVVIIDDNKERREIIKNFLPDYAEGFVSDSGNSAISALKPDGYSRIPDLVILNADDENGRGLFVFDWIANNEPAFSGVYIPVILLTKDEFSDKMLDFLEISDAFIYEGEPEEERFFSVFIEALDSVEPVALPQPSYTEEVSPERILGHTLDAHLGPDDNPVRSAVLNLDERLLNLEAALERGRKRSQEIKILLSEAQGIKEEKARAALANRRSSSMLSRARERAKGNELSGRATSIIKNKEALNQQLKVSNFTQQFMDIGVAKGADAVAVAKKLERLVVVSDDVAVHKLIKLFLKDKYDIIILDSGMKAIDYFVRNRAEIVIVDAVLANLSGAKTLASMRWQPFGKEVPAIFLVDDNYKGNGKELTGENIYGTLRKPFSKGAVIEALGQVPRNRK